MFSWNQITLLIAPWLLLATTSLCYRLLERHFGARKAYLFGFLFYWTVWCGFFPLVILGPQAFVHLFHSIPGPFGQPWWLGAFCLLAPPLVAFQMIFPKSIQQATWKGVALSGVLAVVNGILEEVLWRGAYILLFPGQFWLAVLYPTTGFALWHFAPQLIFPYKGPGGRIALVAQVWFLGFLWAWVANNTGIILWTAIAHILIDFSALGWGPKGEALHNPTSMPSRDFEIKN